MVVEAAIGRMGRSRGDNWERRVVDGMGLGCERGRERCVTAMKRKSDRFFWKMRVQLREM